MNELDKFIKEMNLVFTNTLTRDDFCVVDFDLDKQEINYNNSISLYELLNKFNTVYQKFKTEYNNLNINLAEKIDFVSYSKKEDYRCLGLYLQNPLMANYKETMFYLRNDKEKSMAFITNNSFGKYYYYKIIEIEDIKIIEILDLFEKYEDLFNIYNYLKNQLVFGDSTNVLLTRIDGDIFKNITNFKLYIGQLYFNYTNNISIDVNIEDELKINSDKVEAELKSNTYPLTDEDVNKILTKTYINKKYLRRR